MFLKGQCFQREVLKMGRRQGLGFLSEYLAGYCFYEFSSFDEERK